MLTKGRMEALNDGVLAFAMTLLVVDLALRPPGSPLHQFLAAWTAYLAYVVSFLTIGSGWIAHNALTDALEQVDRIFLNSWDTTERCRRVSHRIGEAQNALLQSSRHGPGQWLVRATQRDEDHLC